MNLVSHLAEPSLGVVLLGDAGRAHDSILGFIFWNPTSKSDT
jgi:hypothetical protein